MLQCRATRAFTHARCYNTEHHWWWECKMLHTIYMLAFYRAKHKPIIGTSNTTSRYCPWEIKIYIYTNPHIQMFIAALFKLIKWGTSVSFSWWANKQTPVHLWYRILLSCKKQQAQINKHMNLKWTMLSRRSQFCLYDILQKTKLKRQPSLNSGGLGVGRNVTGDSFECYCGISYITLDIC